MKKKLCLALALALIALALAGCDQKTPEPGEIAEFSFSDSIDFSAIQALDGKTVRIKGYMATLSPISGKYMYLMNMPYQSCPFCVPNTTQLANTMAVYAPDGKTFAYTDQAIRVTGTLRVEDYTDEFTYEYNYRIVDAEYEVIDLAAVSAEYALWTSVAGDGILAELGAMFDFVYFACQWTEYQSYYTNDAGERVDFYLYPGDVQNLLVDSGPYGYADKNTDAYFSGLISRARAISKDGLEDLAQIILDAQTLKNEALAELNDGKYTYNAEEDKYVLGADVQLYASYAALYTRFSQWLSKWQL